MSTSTLHSTPFKHLHFENLDKWLLEAKRLGFLVREPNPDTVRDAPPFPFVIAVSSTYNARIMGACFTKGLTFGWLRKHGE